VFSATLPDNYIDRYLSLERKSHVELPPHISPNKRKLSISSQNNSKASPIKNDFSYEISCLKQENAQLKALNNRLIDKQTELEEELSKLAQKHRLNEMLLSSNGTNKDTDIEISKVWTSKLKQELDDLRSQHALEQYKLKHSFAIELEELNEVISTLTLEIDELIKQKAYHGAKFIEILDKAKEK